MYNINLYWADLPLKMKTLRCVETSGSDHPVTQRRIPEERLLQKYFCENFKPSKSGLVSLFLIPKKKKGIIPFEMKILLRTYRLRANPYFIIFGSVTYL